MIDPKAVSPMTSGASCGVSRREEGRLFSPIAPQESRTRLAVGSGQEP